MTGSMNKDRDTYSLTLLQNDQVLAAGGDEDQYPLASDTAELYNPARGTWTYTSELMKVAQQGHTATLLPNGKVLVVGGMDPFSNMQATAELYTPTTGTWMLTGSMATLRTGHTATLLPSGQVLVAAGEVNVNCTSTAELYNPATGTWTYTGTLHNTRTLHSAALLQSGQVLVAGGIHRSYSGDIRCKLAETYTP
jgi:N-acetylneuraminic acid mutarotase